jgi:hypothetical protein
MYLGQIAEYIWDIEVGDGVVGAPGFIDTEKQKIEDYLEVNMGTLNTLINSEFCVANSETTIAPGVGGWTAGGNTKIVTPALKREEVAILIQIYLRDYYKKKARSTLTSATSADIDASLGSVSDWTELREGDSVIKRVATVASPAQKTAASKSFENLSGTAGTEINNLVQKYNLYLSKPRQVISKDGG